MFLKAKQKPSPWPFALPRHIVRHFAGLMEMVLRDNDWKGGWEKSKSNNTIHFFRDKLWEEYMELQALLKDISHGVPVDANRIAREAADVANVAMMIADNWGRTAEHAIRPMIQSQGCKLPPRGWVCTREPGHEGPCAAWPEGAQLPAVEPRCPHCHGTKKEPGSVRHDPRIPPTICRDTFHDEVPAGYKGCE